MTIAFRPPLLAAASLAALTAANAHAQESPRHGDILVTAEREQRIDNAPATRATLDAATIAATVNAVNVEDTIKYLPSLVVRKRHIGDNFAPIATRTSGIKDDPRYAKLAEGFGANASRGMFWICQKQAWVSIPLAMSMLLAA